ncbi:MAG: hypothetical protein JWQ35_211 [Bacteriovoracaceae bacterium]|nr:hypothetical protein [Bacteriovoracaceae bacterium]
MKTQSITTKTIHTLILLCFALAPFVSSIAEAKSEVRAQSQTSPAPFKLLLSTTNPYNLNAGAFASTGLNTPQPKNAIILGCIILGMGAVFIYGLMKMCKLLNKPINSPPTNNPPEEALPLIPPTNSPPIVSYPVPNYPGFNVSSMTATRQSSNEFVLPSDYSFWFAAHKNTADGQWGDTYYIQSQWDGYLTVTSSIYDKDHHLIRKQVDAMTLTNNSNGTHDANGKIDTSGIDGLNPLPGQPAWFGEAVTGMGWLNFNK